MMPGSPPQDEYQYREQTGKYRQQAVQVSQRPEDSLPVAPCQSPQEDQQPVPDRRGQSQRQGRTPERKVADAREDGDESSKSRQEAAEENDLGAVPPVQPTQALQLAGPQKPVAEGGREETSSPAAARLVDAQGAADIEEPRGQKDPGGRRPPLLGDEGAGKDEGVGGNGWEDVLDRRPNTDDQVDDEGMQISQVREDPLEERRFDQGV